MTSSRLYGDLAWMWPIISPPQDHVEEARRARDVIVEHAGIEVESLLHLGCGGGHDDFGLKRWFRVTGVDLSPRMLELARGLNPEADYHEGDMRSVRLDRTFDAVFLGDAVCYMLSEEDLAAAFRTAFEHLEPGGAFITFVELTPETFVQNRTTVIQGRKGSAEIVFIENYYDPDPSDTTLEATFQYLIREDGEQRMETDHHLLGLFPVRTWIDRMEDAGFTDISDTVVDLPDYPGLHTLVGVRPVGG
jgi:SAM-dependent methyltransferase